MRDDVADELGLPRGLPVAAGGGDNAAAAVGVGVVREGAVSTSIGTSGVLFAHRDEFSRDPSGRVHAFCHAVPGAFHLMAVTLSAGGSLSWWRERLGGGADFETLVGEASAVAPGAEGLVFLPYLTGERSPHLDAQARGGFVGLTVRHGRAHMTRAVMEGVAFSMRDGLEVMRGLGTPDDDLRAVGGGARSPLWLRLQADVYGRPIRRTLIDEGPAYGAALLGGRRRGRVHGRRRCERARADARRGHGARSRARAPLRRAVRGLRVAVSGPARLDARARPPRRRLSAYASGRRRILNSSVPWSSTVTNPAMLGGSMPKSANAIGAEPASSIVESPIRCERSVTSTGCVLPCSVSLPRRSRLGARELDRPGQLECRGREAGGLDAPLAQGVVAP